MVTPASGLVEAYRKADHRLCLMLIGDGIGTPGLLKGEELRRRVTAELRHMRYAFNASVGESEEPPRAENAEARVAELEEELRRIASVRSRMQQPPTEAPALLTPAEAAQALRISASALYKAIRNGDIKAVRLTGTKRGTIRVPASELHGLLEDVPLQDGRIQR
jgi:excisionase family DNA binding protein